MQLVHFIIYFFIFILDETLQLDYQEYIKPPKLLFPLDLKDGSKDVISGELVGIEQDLAFDDLWTPAGLKGSPLFDSSFTSKGSILLPIKDEIEITNQFTIMMWVKPTHLENSAVFFVR